MPWLGTILIAGAAALGRLVSVQLLPTSTIAIVVWLTLRAHAFNGETAGLQWHTLIADFRVDTGGVLLFVLVVFASAVVLQPFEVATVRLLEGYWRSNRVGGGVANALSMWHRWRFRWARRTVAKANATKLALMRQSRSDAEKLGPVPLQVKRRNDKRKSESRARRARELQKRYPPTEEQVLPTVLGNILRVAERHAGERYYLSTVETLPRLYQHLSPRLGSAYDAAVDTLDAAARMAVSTAMAALFTMVAFYDDSDLWWIPGVLASSSFLSYRGAVSAAMQYGLFMDIAYDLHRFDLIKALHLDLPTNTEEEEEIGEQLRIFFAEVDAKAARIFWRGKRTRYWHYEEHARPADSSVSQDGEDATKRS
jgi:hypothetical protein